MDQAQGNRILELTRENGLHQADYLAEHEAIILSSTWEVIGAFGATIPAAVEYEMDRRSRELDTFFRHGGVLVVLLTPAINQLSSLGRGHPDNHYWWTNQLGLGLASQQLVLEGAGTSVNILEPGHDFETYLEAAPPYKARLANSITTYGQVSVLAENRAAEPVAVEIAVGSGSAIIIPPPATETQDRLLRGAIDATLRSRFGLGFEWRVPEELELEEERHGLLRELREKRADLDRRRSEVQRFKAQIFQQLEVRRALNYWRDATGPGATPKKAMYALHAMLEMLDGYFATSRPEVAKLLGVSHNSMRRITELANRKTLNLRHTMEGSPDNVDPEEYNRILREAHDIVQAFINWSYREVARPRIAT